MPGPRQRAGRNHVLAEELEGLRRTEVREEAEQAHQFSLVLLSVQHRVGDHSHHRPRQRKAVRRRVQPLPSPKSLTSACQETAGATPEVRPKEDQRGNRLLASIEALALQLPVVEHRREDPVHGRLRSCRVAQVHQLPLLGLLVVVLVLLRGAGADG